MRNERTRATVRALALGTVVTLALASCSHEAADWKSATLANTSEAYQSFLQQYPHSRETTEAQSRVKQLTEERDWQNAIAANTRDAYQDFMAQHPDSKWGQEAKIRVENFAQTDSASARGSCGCSQLAHCTRAGRSCAKCRPTLTGAQRRLQPLKSLERVSLRRARTGQRASMALTPWRMSSRGQMNSGFNWVHSRVKRAPSRTGSSLPSNTPRSSRCSHAM